MAWSTNPDKEDHIIFGLAGQKEFLDANPFLKQNLERVFKITLFKKIFTIVEKENEAVEIHFKKIVEWIYAAHRNGSIKIVDEFWIGNTGYIIYDYDGKRLAILFPDKDWVPKNVWPTHLSHGNRFSSIAFPTVRRIFPSLLANDIISVQPMPLSSGLLFYNLFKSDDKDDDDEEEEE